MWWLEVFSEKIVENIILGSGSLLVSTIGKKIEEEADNDKFKLLVGKTLEFIPVPITIGIIISTMNEIKGLCGEYAGKQITSVLLKNIKNIR